jgi:chromosome segregation ATPase
MLETINILSLDNKKLNVDKDKLIAINNQLSVKVDELENKGLYISKLKVRVESLNDTVNKVLKSIELIGAEMKDYKVNILKRTDEIEVLVKVQISKIERLKTELNSSSNDSESNLKEVSMKLTEANAKLKEMEVKLRESEENVVRTEIKLNELTAKLNTNEKRLVDIDKECKSLEKENKKLKEQLAAKQKDKTLFELRKELDNRSKNLQAIKEQKQ